MQLPVAVNKIISRLESSGYEAYAVGGCVRDSLLGRIPGDYDITTSALPKDIKRIFRRTIDTGIDHGTVTVLIGGDDPVLRGQRGYEVTTYRIDGEYLDGRHPSSVTFTPSLKEDLARRDFTINAMACNERTGIVDEFGGQEDLRKGLIRAVGIPERRFQEDALRMLRAVRFSAQLNFTIEDKTFEGIRELAPNLEKISKERIAAELTKLLTSEHPEKLSLVYEGGLAPYITKDFCTLLPELPFLPASAPKLAFVRYGMLFRGRPDACRKVLRELKCDNTTISNASSISKLYEDRAVLGLIESAATKEEQDYLVRKLLSQYGTTILAAFLDMMDAIHETTGTGKARISIRNTLSSGSALSIRDLALNGTDLMAYGVKKGPEIGLLLRKMLEHVLRYPEDNSKEKLAKLLSDDRFSSENVI